MHATSGKPGVYQCVKPALQSRFKVAASYASSSSSSLEHLTLDFCIISFLPFLGTIFLPETNNLSRKEFDPNFFSVLSKSKNYLLLEKAVTFCKKIISVQRTNLIESTVVNNSIVSSFYLVPFFVLYN